MSCDIDFANVSLLLHFDGTNGQTSAVDSSSVGNIITFTGAAALSTADPAFGTASLAVQGSSADYVSTPVTASGPLDLSTGDFTIEFWINPVGILTSEQPILSAYDGVSNGYSIVLSATTGLPSFIFGAAFGVTHGTAPVPGSWTAIAVVRQGNVFDLWVNGVASGDQRTQTGSIGEVGPLYIGAAPNYAAGAIDGTVDEVRITKGIARYTPGVNYTPAGPFDGTCVVIVPNVVGEVLATAESDITAALLAVGTVTTGYDPVIPAGSVSSQNPVGGAIAMQGDSVDLVNSLGPAPTAVPDVTGMSLAAAESTLTTAGFTVGTITLATSATVPVGNIISQSPVAGTFEPVGAPIDLVESEGPTSLLIPDLTNLSVPIATALLSSLGLVLGAITYQYDAIIIAGNIDGQSPAPGGPASPGDVVAVAVSSGLPPLTVPDLFGLTQTDAINLLLSLGLVPGAIGSAPSKFVPPGEVQAQNPSAGIAVAVGTIVSFVLSQGTPVAGTLFDFEATVISQYANSPTILQLCNNLNQYIDQSANFANFFNFVWNVDTAVGFGLDIWGKIVGVSRLLQIPNTTKYVGFYQPSESQPAQDWTPAGSDQPPYNNPPVGGAFYTGDNATTAYLLPDDSYRQLILAKAFANIASTTAPAMNQILQNLYGPGTAFVLNTGPMAISYNLTFTPTAIQLAILEQSGVIPTPPGVSVVINTNV